MLNSRESRQAKSVRWAYKRGYRVLEDGSVISPFGNARKLRFHSRGRSHRYLCFTVKPDGRSANLMVHQLAAYQKFGEESLLEGVVVRHLDGNALNNRHESIGIGDMSDNMMDRAPLCRHIHSAHAASFLRSLSEDQVKSLRSERAAGAKYKDLMAKYGVSKSTVSYIVNGKTYAKVS